MTKCGWCGELIEPGTSGRPRKYCSKTHRQYAYMQRRSTVGQPQAVVGWTPQLQQRLVAAVELGHVEQHDLKKPTVLRPVVGALVDVVDDALRSLGGVDAADPGHEVTLARYQLAPSAVLAVNNARESLAGGGRSAVVLARHRDSLVSVAVALADPTYRPAEGNRRIPVVVPPDGVVSQAGLFNAWAPERGRTEVFWRHEGWDQADTDRWGRAGVPLDTALRGGKPFYKLQYPSAWTELATVMVAAVTGYEDRSLPPVLEAAAVAVGRHLAAEFGRGGWQVHTSDVAGWCDTFGYTRIAPSATSGS